MPFGPCPNETSSVDGPLVPGLHRTLTLTIRNGHSWPVHLLRADVGALTPGDAPGCLAEWVTAERELDGLVLMNVDVNQNACKGSAIPLQLSAVGAEVLG